FVLWGLYFAFLLVLEKYFLRNLLNKLPVLLRHLYVIFLIIISFVIFNGNSLEEVADNLRGMFGLLDVALINPETMYYAKSYGLVFALAMIGTTPIPALLINKISSNKFGYFLINLLKPVVIVILLLTITGYLIDGSFNPFLYFRF
ncbi:MAG: MBOAT family protein, partial [Clostridiales bacterium]|nr:MBOAT family protein [Clostridiales bacterium]